MPFEGHPMNILTFTATAATLAQNLFVQLDTSESGLNCEVAGANGVIQGITVSNTDAAGQPISVATAGWTYLTVNGNSSNISKDDPLESTTAGIGIKAETDKHNVGAYALDAATTDGVKIRVAVAPLRQAGV